HQRATGTATVGVDPLGAPRVAKNDRRQDRRKRETRSDGECRHDQCRYRPLLGAIRARQAVPVLCAGLEE
ncbi:unnamed protein product, partial [Ectocarpus fasciculatus]